MEITDHEVVVNVVSNLDNYDPFDDETYDQFIFEPEDIVADTDDKL